MPRWAAAVNAPWGVCAFERQCRAPVQGIATLTAAPRQRGAFFGRGANASIGLLRCITFACRMPRAAKSASGLYAWQVARPEILFQQPASE